MDYNKPKIQPQEQLSPQPKQGDIEIPTKYQGLPSELVEDLWVNPVYIDKGKNQEEKERREKTIALIKEKESKREDEKAIKLSEKYRDLPDQEKVEFSKLYEQSKQVIANFFNEKEVLSLLPEEEFVLNKMKIAYSEAKEKNPDQPVSMQFSRDIDQKVYLNLLNRLAFENLKEIKGAEEEKIKQNQIDTIQKKIGIEKTETTESKYSKFKVKNGETDIGVWWYEYRNQAAKELKDSKQFEWGKERIYFDISLDNMEELRDLAMKVASNNDIPIAFKYLDRAKTHQVNLKNESKTTRFVTNFASIEDAKKFYRLISQNPEYQTLKPDQNIDFSGFNIDGVAHYASGYRERRSALKNMINSAKPNLDGSYTYTAMIDQIDGTKKPKEMKLTQEELEKFRAQYNAMPDPKKQWEESK